MEGSNKVVERRSLLRHKNQAGAHWFHHTAVTNVSRSFSGAIFSHLNAVLQYFRAALVS